MIVADTNVWIAYLEGDQASDTKLLEIALRFEKAFMLPPVLTELLSEPGLPAQYREFLESIPRVPLTEGFWSRCGDLRANLLSRGHKPKLGDSIIAQLSIDYGAPLLTRDKGFAIFAKHAGLILAK
jgi:predicted nucleic acid-binding protein